VSAVSLPAATGAPPAAAPAVTASDTHAA
jgi:hypothetical protein